MGSGGSRHSNVVTISNGLWGFDMLNFKWVSEAREMEELYILLLGSGGRENGKVIVFRLGSRGLETQRVYFYWVLRGRNLDT